MGIFTAALEVDLLPASGDVSAAGNNVLVTPTSGKAIRLYYASYNPVGGDTLAAFRFGTAGTLFLRNDAVQGAIIAKNLRPDYMQGDPDEPLFLYLAVAVSTRWNVLYAEV